MKILTTLFFSVALTTSAFAGVPGHNPGARTPENVTAPYNIKEVATINPQVTTAIFNAGSCQTMEEARSIVDRIPGVVYVDIKKTDILSFLSKVTDLYPIALWNGPGFELLAVDEVLVAKFTQQSGEKAAVIGVFSKGCIIGHIVIAQSDLDLILGTNGPQNGG